MFSFLAFLRNQWGLLKQLVQCRSEHDEKKRKITEEADFLGDVDRLNQAIEMKEVERKKRAERKLALRIDTDEQLTCDYSSMEQNGDGNLDGEKQEQQPPEEKVDFFQEFIQFARNRSWKKKLMTVLVMSASLYVIIDLLFLGHVLNFITQFLNWMTEHPVAGIFCFVGLFVVSILLFVPPTILYFGAGYAFSRIMGFWAGLFVGIAVCFVGASLGAVLAFLRSRYMMRDLVELFSKRFPIVKCLDEAMSQKGFYIMFLMRLCPIIPFNGLNHIGGITKITLKEFSFAMVGIIPFVVLWVLVGASAEKMGSPKVRYGGQYVFLVVLMSVGILFAVVGIFVLYRYARATLLQEIEARRAQNWHAYTEGSGETFQDEYSPSKLDDDPIQQEFEAIQRQPNGIIAVVFGLNSGNVTKKSGQVTALVPEDGSDEDVLWVWA